MPVPSPETAALEIIIALALIVANGLFVMSEAALLAARKTRLQQRADEGDLRAQAALELAQDPNSFLATVQIFITLIGTLLGAFSGATLARPVTALFNQVPALQPYSEGLSVTLVVVIVTYVSLIIGELVPKTLALNTPEALIAVMARPMRILTRLAAPLVGVLNASSRAVIRLLGIKTVAEAPVTEEEINVMISQGMQAGTFQEVERHLIEQVFRITDLNIGALMTPRTEIAWLEVNDTPADIQKTLQENRFARYPVAQGNLDNVIGIVHTHDLLAQVMTGQPCDLRSALHTPLFVPETALAYRVLESLRQSGVHTALVIDEYSGVQGLVTLNDVLEEIVGDALLPNVHEDEPQVMRRADGSMLVDGKLSIDRLKAVLKLKTLGDEDTGDYQTLGGFILAQLEHIPLVAESFEADGWRFEVVDMDGHRVDKVLISHPVLHALPQSESNNPAGSTATKLATGGG
jgi:putative hemolysin